MSVRSRPPRRSCLVFLHSTAFCCINFGNVGRVYSNVALSGKINYHHPVYKHVKRDELRVFQALDIYAKSIERLYEVFVQIDRDGSGEISVTEFFRFFSHKRRFPNKSKFAKRVFSIMDADGSGELDFSEFVIALWNFCTFTKPSLLRFSFELYDTDGSGYLDAPEIRLILREVYGKDKYKTGQAAKFILGTVERMIETGSPGLNISDFCEFCRHHPALLFPAFELQQALQQNVLGSQFWAACAKRRNKKKNQNETSAHRQDAWTSTADMSINELNSFLESWKNAAPPIVEYDSGAEGEGAEGARWEDGQTNVASVSVLALEDEKDEKEEDNVNEDNEELVNKMKDGRRSRSINPSATARVAPTMNRQRKKYVFRKKEKKKKMVAGKSGKSSKKKTPKPKPIVLKKTKPWTCLHCGRMNTHSKVCGTCQKNKV